MPTRFKVCVASFLLKRISVSGVFDGETLIYVRQDGGNVTVGGHDSSEDAIACMELMIWRLKEDARKEARA